MQDSRKFTVLLADEDALRRDGLAAVLKANPELDVIASCPDGQTAMEEIRDLLPNVAIVDLNLPGLHGIELVRRVRGESLGVKMIILAGTMDDEIVREVVRAGADAYLLKNGPARHLTDAINYVMDGGQYFSPQLGRDGRDRHLLEEPPRVPPELQYRQENDDRPRREVARRPRGPMRHTADPERFRERIREEGSRDLRDRDYDIMAEMADGIRPILDRLDEIENRVVEMEEGDSPVPANPRSWLSEQLADTLGGGRSGKSKPSGGRMSNADLDRLPELIDEAVTKRFQSMAGKLQAEIEDQHIRTLETFVKNIQVKLVQRVSMLEQNMNQQAEAMHQLREYNQRTEDNLSRLISGVDKLATELPKRLAAAQAEGDKEGAPERGTFEQTSSARSGRDESRESKAKESRSPRNSGGSGRGNLVPKLFWAGAAVVVLAGGGYVLHKKSAAPTTVASAKDAQAATKSDAAPVAAAAAKPAAPAANADTATKLTAAKQYMDSKDYATAEDIFKQILQNEPNNVDALKGLASTLYREDKIEESAAVLDRLPKN